MVTDSWCIPFLLRPAIGQVKGLEALFGRGRSKLRLITHTIAMAYHINGRSLK